MVPEKITIINYFVYNEKETVVFPRKLKIILKGNANNDYSGQQKVRPLS